MKISGYSAYQAASNQLNNSAKSYASGKILDGATSAIESEVQGKAGKKLIQAQDEMLGTLLDLKA